MRTFASIEVQTHNKIKKKKPDTAGAHGVDEVVGEHEVHTRVHVGLQAKVVAIPVDKALACFFFS